MTSAPDPGVYISTAQMYQEVRGLAQTAGRIERYPGNALDGKDGGGGRR